MYCHQNGVINKVYFLLLCNFYSSSHKFFYLVSSTAHHQPCQLSGSHDCRTAVFRDSCQIRKVLSSRTSAYSWCPGLSNFVSYILLILKLRYKFSNHSHLKYVLLDFNWILYPQMAFTDERGFRHPSAQVRSRTSYLFSRFIKGLK